MEELQNFTLKKLYEKLALPEQDFEEWIKGMGLLHNRRTCQCGSEMEIRAKQNRYWGTWRCPRRECRREFGYLKGTFFEGSHLHPRQVFQLSYLWIVKYGTMELIEHETGLARQTIVDWFIPLVEAFHS